MKDKGKLLDKVAMGFELPTEGLPGLPLVELVGHRRLLVENHKGIIQYGCNEIRIKVCYGQLSVCGSRLELARMTKQQLVIVGCIDSICIFRGDT